MNPPGEPGGWPGGRARHGGVDEIPLPGSAGRLWLCGKHFVGPDPDGALELVGARVVVCLCEEPELVERFPAYVRWLTARPDRAVWSPVPDLHAPTMEQAASLLGRIRALLDGGGGVLMHCGAGIGRAGTMAAAILVDMGMSPADAVARVAAHRPMAGPEAGPQAELLEALARAAGGVDQV